MRRLLAISLLLVHLYSLYGHTVLYFYSVYRSNQLFNEQISMDKYSLDDLVSVKIPVKMPTVENWKDYVAIAGQVQFQNNSYNYVKIKMTKDTLYLMCVPNYKKTKLINQNVINARRIADIPSAKKDHIPFGKQITLNDYNLQALKYSFTSPVKTVVNAVGTVNASLVACSLPNPAPPPKC